MKIKINVHSFIDVITNSSTEIFSRATKNTIDTVYEMIQYLLDRDGLCENARDIAKVGYTFDAWSSKQEIAMYIEFVILNYGKISEKALQEGDKLLNDPEWEGHQYYVDNKESLINMQKNNELMFNSSTALCNLVTNTSIIVKLVDKYKEYEKVIDIMKEFANSFETEEYYY